MKLQATVLTLNTVSPLILTLNREDCVNNYRIPEVLKPEVQRQIEELLRNGFIQPSNSLMASPIVAVFEGPYRVKMGFTLLLIIIILTFTRKVMPL